MRNLMNIVSGLALLVSGSLMAQPFEEGKHFDRIGSPVAMPEDRVVVTDGFAYPCGACRRFLPYVTTWAENTPDHVEVEHLPIALQPGWDLFVRGYYTAQVMGVADETHEAMFQAVHDERRQFRSLEDIAEFYAEYGVDADSFINTSESFAVDAKVRQNRNDVRTYGIRGTPTVVVQGKWRVSPGGVKTYEEMLEVVEFLVEREAEALGLADSGDEGADAQEEVVEPKQADDTT